MKTLGPSHADDGYRATRAFCTGVGFIPVAELWIWGPDNPALILCKPILRCRDMRTPSAETANNGGRRAGVQWRVTPGGLRSKFHQ